MKNLTYFAIPVFVVIFLLAGAFVWKIVTPGNTVVTTTAGTLPNSLDSAAGGKPTSAFSFLFGAQSSDITPNATPTPATAAEMNVDLLGIGDDGGASDLSSLSADANGL